VLEKEKLKTNRQTSHSSTNFREIVGVCKDVYAFFVDLDKASDRSSSRKLGGVLRECGVDGQ